MQVRFGDDVYGVAGKRLGEVDGVIVDAGTKRVRAIVVAAGPFDRTKQMIAVSAIASSDDSGLHLDTSAANADANAPVIDSEEVAFTQRVEPPTTFIPAAGVGGPVMTDDPAVPGEYPNDPSFFELAPLDPPPVEIESNLGENEVQLGKGTDVLSSDHHKIGDLAALDLGDMGLVDHITVSEGFLLRKSASFSLSDIGEFGTNEVHLRLTQDEAEVRQ